MKTLHKLLLAIGLIGTVSTANAIPVVWTLDTTLVYDRQGGHTVNTVKGTFTYDADTNIFTNTSVIGTTTAFGGRSYDFTLLSGSANQINFQFNGGNLITFTFDTLTNNGGSVVLTGGSWNFVVKLTSGSLTGVPQATASAVPEPEAYAMMLAGLGLVGFAARRQLAK